MRRRWRLRPCGCGAIFSPEDVVEGGRLGSVFAEAGEALSAMVLAVHEDLGEPFGEGGLGFQDGQLESSFEVAFGEVGDEGELLLVGGAVDLDLLVEGFGTLGFHFPVEGPVEEAGEKARCTMTMWWRFLRICSS
jgi:hypothetical protein